MAHSATGSSAPARVAAVLNSLANPFQSCNTYYLRRPRGKSPVPPLPLSIAPLCMLWSTWLFVDGFFVGCLFGGFSDVVRSGLVWFVLDWFGQFLSGLVLSRLGQLGGQLGAKIWPDWSQLGATSGPSWAKLGQVGAMLGPGWGKLGQVGPSWAKFGAKLGPSWAKLGHLEPTWGQVGGQVGAKLATKSQKMG